MIIYLEDNGTIKGEVAPNVKNNLQAARTAAKNNAGNMNTSDFQDGPPSGDY